MARKAKPTTLKPPYLRRVWLDPKLVPDMAAYPFCLPLFGDHFEWTFDAAITIVVGENGVGKSTLLEGIAVLAGFDDAGGGKGYKAVDDSNDLATSGGDLAQALRAAWLPKVTNGWFFKAESFFAVARYLDDAATSSGRPDYVGPDYLSHSHGEGFLRFFEERCSRHGLYFFDEPESALSPSRQLSFLRLLQRLDHAANAQVIIATHSPLLMAYPGATLLKLTKYGLEPTTLQQTDHYRLMHEFCQNPAGFVDEALAEINPS
jgi:predicted ATPase